MKHLALLLLLFSGALQATAEEPAPATDETTPGETQTDEDAQQLAWARNLWDSLDRKQGEIRLPNGVATLQVPQNFYYLDPKDTAKVLTEVWGNPPDTAAGTLGMLFPADMTPFDAVAWGVTIRYEEDGYVTDEDADVIDYDSLLKDMQASVREASDERVAKGYEAFELVGWAHAPYYDKADHKLYWAQEVHFSDQPSNTLNYNIRVLGRKGVLLLNFIADMDQQGDVDASLDTVLAMADFDQGSRYEDFNPDLDKVAAYGIGALVAGKLAAKVGLLAGGLLLLKKFGVLVVAGAAAVAGKFFKRKKV